MSDTAAPRRSRRGRCCAALLVAGLLLGVWGASTARRLTADAPLAFEPFQLRPLERQLQRAKFELLEAGGRLLDREVTVVLDERELNVMLFADAGQTPERKARVLLQGEQLRLESTTPRDGGGYWNLSSDLKVVMGPQGLVDVTILGGQVGDVGLSGPLLRLVEGKVEEHLRDAATKDPRLGKLRGLWLEGGRVKLVYLPSQR